MYLGCLCSDFIGVQIYIYIDDVLQTTLLPCLDGRYTFFFSKTTHVLILLIKL